MDLPDAIEVVRPSIVQVLVGPAQTHPGASQVVGTGFWVHPSGLAMTAKHVAQEAQRLIAQAPGGRIMLGLALPSLTGPPLTVRGSFELLDAQVLEEDRRHDIAILRAGRNPFASGRASGVSQTSDGMAVNSLYGLSTVARSEVRDGEPVAVSGYPLAEPALVTTSGTVASAFATDVQQVQLPHGPAGFTVPDIADSYLIDVAVNPGNSGGPVYRIETGEVIGVCVAFRIGSARFQSNPFFYNSGLSVVVPIKYGQELCSRHV